MKRKKCSKCKRFFSVDKFYIRKSGKLKGRLFSRCKECDSITNGHTPLKKIKRFCKVCKKRIKKVHNNQRYCSKCKRKPKIISLRRQMEFRQHFWGKNLWKTIEPDSVKIQRGYKVCTFKYVRIAQHRLIIMRKFKRRLFQWEEVHHLNGKKLDNRLENLQLVTDKYHPVITKLMTENKKLRQKITYFKSLLQKRS